MRSDVEGRRAQDGQSCDLAEAITRSREAYRRARDEVIDRFPGGRVDPSRLTPEQLQLLAEAAEADREVNRLRAARFDSPAQE